MLAFATGAAVANDRLIQPPYDLSPGAIGLFGLAGAAGAGAAVAGLAVWGATQRLARPVSAP